jgi:hypothetical protein
MKNWCQQTWFYLILELKDTSEKKVQNAGKDVRKEANNDVSNTSMYIHM